MRLLREGQKKLFLNVLSIVFITTIIYALLSFVFQYNLSINRFTGSSDFITIILLGLFSYIGYDIVSGKIKLNKKKFARNNRNTPKKQKQSNQTRHTKKEQKSPRGTALCPQCHHLMIGTYCSRCRITWDEDELSY